MFGFEPNICPLFAASAPDEKELHALREKNLKSDLISLRDMAAAEDEESIDSARPVIEEPLTLSDAIGYAIKYNLDAAISKLEEDIQEEAVFGAKLKMLPSLKFDGELGRADKYSASFSDPLFTDGAQAYNYSRDKSTRKFHLELSWDLLDFGISYYQHRQAFNQLSIVEQKRRRIIQNLKLDVTKTFWQVQVSKAAVQMAGRLIDRLLEREKIMQDQIESLTVSEIEVLETAVALSEMKMKMSGFESELQKNKHKLATLMGMTDLIDFEVASTDFNAAIDKMDLDIKEFETEALRQRPEMFEQDLEEIINVDEARISVAKMAPSSSIFYRFNYDHDSHLYYNHWHDIGLRLSFDLLSVPQKQSQKRAVQKKEKLIRKRRLALATAILTQLNIAILDYEDTMRKYEQSKDIASKRAKLMQARRLHAENGNGNLEDILESEARHLLSQVRSLSSYADAIIAEQRILNTIGRDDMVNVHYVQKKESVPARNTETGDTTVPEKQSLEVREEDLSEDKQAHVLDDGFEEKVQLSPISQTPDTCFRYSILLSSWHTLNKATKILSYYKKQGMNTYAARVDLNEKGVWWRCFAGYYKTWEDAVRAKEKLELIDATVMQTPFVNLVGLYSTEKAMQDMSLKLGQLAFFPYVVKGEDNSFRLLTGAFMTRKEAEDQNSDLKTNGIQAQVVRR